MPLSIYLAISIYFFYSSIYLFICCLPVVLDTYLTLPQLEDNETEDKTDEHARSLHAHGDQAHHGVVPHGAHKRRGTFGASWGAGDASGRGREREIRLGRLGVG